MNFLDPYDVTSSSTPPPSQPQQSLNEEVNQVLGQLGRFWGGVRKQGQTALETARKDFEDVVVQAQNELNRFTATAPAASSSGDEGSEKRTLDNAAEQPVAGPSGQPHADMSDETSSSPTGNAGNASATMQTFFSRLQSVIPPNVVSTVQHNLAEPLKHASENIDFGQIRTTLAHEVQRVQGATLTRAQLEDYMHKSENLFKDVVKEAGEVLRDAVKVIPPEESSASTRASGLVWDGTDMWMLPDGPEAGAAKLNEKGKASVQSAVATRAESLLKRLKHDPEIVKHNPEGDAGVKETFNQWIASEVDSREGGMTGTEWKDRTEKDLAGVDGGALKSTHDTLVPTEMDEVTFWKRYYFRVAQIEQEEKKRKALLQESITNEDDFSWEDEEGEEPDPKAAAPTQGLRTKSSTTTLQPNRESEDGSKRAGASHNNSPRESSEGSYDVVSGNVSADEKAGDKKVDTSDDGDSDWE